MNMVNNMFSMFDPSSTYMSYIWLIPITTPMLLMKLKKNKLMNKNYMTTTKYKKSVEMELKQLMMNKQKKMSSMLMTNMFNMVMIINVVAMLPFNFATTAHMSITMTMALTMWLSCMMYGWFNGFKRMMIHLTPIDTPKNLMNFMVLIEMISNIIRPITLSIRLSANMVAGHLLMSLLSGFSMLTKKNLLMSIPVMVTLIALESMVALVQAYVITTLVTLYQNESMI